jgi:hypothetical protein
MHVLGSHISLRSLHVCRLICKHCDFGWWVSSQALSDAGCDASAGDSSDETARHSDVSPPTHPPHLAAVSMAAALMLPRSPPNYHGTEAGSVATSIVFRYDPPHNPATFDPPHNPATLMANDSLQLPCHLLFARLKELSLSVAIPWTYNVSDV